MSIDYGKVISRLIEIGGLINVGKPFEVKGLKYSSRINCLGKDYWQEVCQQLSNDDLIKLIKGLAYVETKYRWIGGSAASTIRLFEILSRRQLEPGLLDSVSAWIFKNTYNRYLPFGTTVTFGATNYSEYKQRREVRDEELAVIELHRVEEQKSSRKHRSWLRRARAKGQLCRNSNLRIEIQQKLDPMTPTERLIFIERDERFAPSFFPTLYASEATSEIMAGLPNDVIDRFVLKMRGKYRGPWGQFKKRLLKAANIRTATQC